ncbi:MAG: 16S rRNA (cytosine(1402)-N(4))-methyltransferase RsmH [Spirochaetales bacterium]|nr:16S rRNA (cytosine(1402)-N(4))-methyltransferase RsmH [Spirochaetales bacterium]
MEPVHQSVLVSEVLEFLAPDDTDRLVIDATVGEGGHSACFLQRFPGIRVIGIDADQVMLERARQRLEEFEGRVELVNEWFDTYFGAAPSAVRPNRILMDLGVSMYHFTKAARGFSFREDEPLDMRLDAGGPLGDRTETAADLVNTLREPDLADLIYQFGEERLSRRIAAAICRERDSRPFRTAAQLADIIRGAVPSSYRHSRIHPATRTFQALRIAVNSELDRVKRAIPAALEMLSPAGRLGIISFHSLEDRIVKHSFRDAAGTGPYRLLTKKPVTASDEERVSNSASRSAKFRVIERVAS